MKGEQKKFMQYDSALSDIGILLQVLSKRITLIEGRLKGVNSYGKRRRV